MKTSMTAKQFQTAQYEKLAEKMMTPAQKKATAERVELARAERNAQFRAKRIEQLTNAEEFVASEMRNAIGKAQEELASYRAEIELNPAHAMQWGIENAAMNAAIVHVLAEVVEYLTGARRSASDEPPTLAEAMRTLRRMATDAACDRPASTSISSNIYHDCERIVLNRLVTTSYRELIAVRGGFYEPLAKFADRVERFRSGDTLVRAAAIDKA